MSGLGISFLRGGTPLFTTGGNFSPVSLFAPTPIVFRAACDLTLAPASALLFRQPWGSKALEQAIDEADVLLPAVTIGFVQNLMRGRRSVSYTPRTQRVKGMRFEEIHKQYPILDRAKDSKDPWYRGWPKNILELGEGEFNFKPNPTNHVERVTVEVDDGPELVFPDPALDYDATVDWDDEFTTCLVAQIARRFYCLHWFRWTIRAQGGLQQLRAPGALLPGIAVIEDQYVLPPYSFPNDFRFDGDLAQDSIKNVIRG